MNKQYGIDYMLSAEDTDLPSSFLITEKEVFEMAKSTKKENRQPFFSMVLGVSTHQPYDRILDSDFILNSPDYPNSYLNYLNLCHYVDKQINDYFEFLKEKEIYDNSLIVIASDHHPHLDLLKMEGRISNNLPLYIINSGIDSKSFYDGHTNQLDVYTTLLDILNINSMWRGLGYSLLSPSYKNSVSQKRYEISEKIIQGDYFRQ